MSVDATQIIVATIVVAGTLYTAWSVRRGQKETNLQQEDANALADRVQDFEQLDQSLVRAREDIENERRWRREDSARHDEEIARERAARAHDAQAIQHLTEALALLRRAVRDEAMQAAAQIALDLADDDIR